MDKNYIDTNATIQGEVALGKQCSVWPGAVIRGDLNSIQIGDQTNVQDNAVLHVSKDHGIKIGNSVTIGHGAIIHGCTIKNNCLIGMGAIIMDGAVIGENSIIGTGTVILEGITIPERSLVLGVPGKIKREVIDEEIKSNKKNAEEYVDEILRKMR